MSTGAAAVGVPRTPTKKHALDNEARLRLAFQQLNDEFNLRLVFPDAAATPGSHLDASQAVYLQLKNQCYNGDLEGTLLCFRDKARETFVTWARPGVGPPRLRSHPARDKVERQAYLDLLVDVLRQRRPIPQPRAKTSHAQHRLGDEPATPPKPLGSSAISPAHLPKRRSDGEPEVDVYKRPRSLPVSPTQNTVARAWNKLDNVAVRSVLQAEDAPHPLASRDRILQPNPHPRALYPPTISVLSAPHHRSVPSESGTSITLAQSKSSFPSGPRRLYSNASANTSVTSLASAVFSLQDYGADGVGGTQTTVDAASQDFAKNPQKRSGRHHDGPQQELEWTPRRRQVEPPKQEEWQPPRVHRQQQPMSRARDLALHCDDEMPDDVAALYESIESPDALPEMVQVSPTKKAAARAIPYRSSSVHKLDSPVSKSDTYYSSIPEDTPKSPVGRGSLHVTAQYSLPKTVSEPPSKFEDRLRVVWPKFPDWLRSAPFAVAWEVTRLGLYWGVDLDAMEISYDPAWVKHGAIRKALYNRPQFRTAIASGAGPRRRGLLEYSDEEAWLASVDGGFKSRDRAVVLSASMDFSPLDSGPLYLLTLHPLRLDQSHRLSRRFGSDRFLEVRFPPPHSPNAPVMNVECVKSLNRWLSCDRHALAGRSWASFYIKDSGYKKPITDVVLGQEVKPTIRERLYLFAESGHDFRPAPGRAYVPPQDEAVRRRTEFGVHGMLDWLLDIQANKSQPYLKLYSRIALGLSKTSSTIVFEPDQIIHHKTDLLSPQRTDLPVHQRPKRKVMNDGIGRMSLSVARKVRRQLGLSTVPCAIQGRLGSAKGMWIIDINDDGEKDWIETYPSQRKWECDETDPAHRTLEFRNCPTQLRSASLNLQFLPVLEDRGRNKGAMRSAIGDILGTNLQAELDSQRAAMESPIDFLQWVHQNSAFRQARVEHGHVPFLGGLPEKDEETMKLMLASGFDPRRQLYLQKIAFDLQKQKCETLKSKLNIRVGRSTYAYMVVDFSGVLKEDEVHLAFSSAFTSEPGVNGDENGFSDTMLHGVDVLVARSPAHYPSDIQKVRAVFHPELKDLKDAIVFPITGYTALADKLSGGDYDGDIAWVCWEPTIVNNFETAPVPEVPDLIARGYLKKITDTMEDLMIQHSSQRREGGGARPGRLEVDEAVTAEWLERSLSFNMHRNFVGICTNFKERFCYNRRNVRDKAAVLLSTLLSNLVDQVKQGIVFDADAWRRLRKDPDIACVIDPPEPAYKQDNWGGVREPDHIIDHLKFTVAKRLIDAELGKFGDAMKRGRTGSVPRLPPSPSKERSEHSDGVAVKAEYWDPDLAVYWTAHKNQFAGSSAMEKLVAALEADIHGLAGRWASEMVKLARQNKGGSGRSRRGDRGATPAADDAAAAGLDANDLVGGADASYPQVVRQLHSEYVTIRPDVGQHRSLAGSKAVFLLEQPFLSLDLATWARLRASTLFKLYYKKLPRMVWSLAGIHLCQIKAEVLSSAVGGGGEDGGSGGDGALVGRSPALLPIPVRPDMYAVLRPDAKQIRQLVAVVDGSVTHYTDAEEQECEPEGEGRGGGGGGGGEEDIAASDEEDLEEWFDVAESPRRDAVASPRFGVAGAGSRRF